MAPKKKGGKKQADDWEADLGETIDPIAQATEAAKKAEAEEDAAEEGMNGGGGLLAALRKNKDKRAKKGKQVVNDFVEGEDPEAVQTAEPADNLDAKAPAEATFDDEDDDVFAGNANKGKGAKGGKKQPDVTPNEDGEDGEGGGMKSKKEKEREKKEREKQRKKEQVSRRFKPTLFFFYANKI